MINDQIYLCEDTVSLGKYLLGKYLFTNIGGIITGGMITETESYLGVSDKACHAYGGRRTHRTEVMYRKGGCAYVYLCYGLHHLLNIVTHREGVPHAILIRAFKPVIGIEEMARRRGSKRIAEGPGMVTQALGITMAQNGQSLQSDTLWLEDRGVKVESHHIKAGPRIGVDYAGEDAGLPYRFLID